MNDMATIKIDGKKIKAGTGKNLLDVARQNFGSVFLDIPPVLRAGDGGKLSRLCVNQ